MISLRLAKCQNTDTEVAIMNRNQKTSGENSNEGRSFELSIHAHEPAANDWRAWKDIYARGAAHRPAISVRYRDKPAPWETQPRGGQERVYESQAANEIADEPLSLLIESGKLPGPVASDGLPTETERDPSRYTNQGSDGSTGDHNIVISDQTQEQGQEQGRAGWSMGVPVQDYRYHQSLSTLATGPSSVIMGPNPAQIPELTLSPQYIPGRSNPQPLHNGLRGYSSDPAPYQQHDDAYMGSHANRRNIAADIPAWKNCRLWITGLPPNCDFPMLLSSIRGVGRIYASHVTPPEDPSTGAGAPTSAASVTFFRRADAGRFLAMHEAHPFTVDGYVATVIEHRIVTDAEPITGRSRVLRIRGPAALVNPGNLDRVFRQMVLHFDTEFVRYTPGDAEAQAEVVWAFGSFRTQAHHIFNTLRRQYGDVLNVVYLADPCE